MKRTLTGTGSRPTFDDAVDSPIDLVLGLGRVSVAGLGADDVDQLDAVFRECPGHHVGGLLLAIVLAAIGHGRAVEQVEGVVGAVIKMP